MSGMRSPLRPHSSSWLPTRCVPMVAVCAGFTRWSPGPLTVPTSISCCTFPLIWTDSSEPCLGGGSPGCLVGTTFRKCCRPAAFEVPTRKGLAGIYISMRCGRGYDTCLKRPRQTLRNRLGWMVSPSQHGADIAGSTAGAPGGGRSGALDVGQRVFRTRCANAPKGKKEQEHGLPWHNAGR